MLEHLLLVVLFHSVIHVLLHMAIILQIMYVSVSIINIPSFIQGLRYKHGYINSMHIACGCGPIS